MKSKRGGRKDHSASRKPEKAVEDESDEDVGDIFTDEISEFTDARNKIDLGDHNDSEGEEEEEMFALMDEEEEEESDEEIGEWSKRLKQIKFQAKLENKKPLPGDSAEKSWGNKRGVFYGSGVKRKPKEAVSDEEDEWTMEEKEIEKLQKRLDEDIDEEDFLVPSLIKKAKPGVSEDLTVKRDLTATEKQEFKKKLHPEAEPLREELNKCIEELEMLKDKKGWKVESKDTCFRLLAANIAFYLHMIENDEDCRGHPVIKRIVQWKKLAKMYEAIPREQMEASDEDDNEHDEDDNEHDEVTNDETKHSSRQKLSRKRTRPEGEDSKDEIDDEMEEENANEISEEGESRPITYEIEKNKPKKKTAPNNPRVKHREKFRKAKIRMKGKIREYRPEINKYQGEASGIRAGIIRSVRLK